jgi:hypothetical protein
MSPVPKISDIKEGIISPGDNPLLREHFIVAFALQAVNAADANSIDGRKNGLRRIRFPDLL